MWHISRIAIMNAVEIRKVWNGLQALALTNRNRQWLADRLIESKTPTRSRAKKQDPTLMTKDEFFAKVDEALEQAKRGEVYRFESNEDMFNWLESL